MLVTVIPPKDGTGLEYSSLYIFVRLQYHCGMQTRRILKSISQWHLWMIFALLGALLGGFAGYKWALAERLAAKEPIFIDEAALHFFARLDTGATVSSINARDIEVVGGSGTPQRSDAGKRVRFTVENAAGQNSRVEATIDQVRGIATSDCRELRYHVYLTVVYDGAPYRLLMNLNDRTNSKDKLLLGRNWLRHGFVVDVSRT